MNNKLQLHLIEKCIKNDSQTQMQLYDLYCKAMFNTACNYIKDDIIAQDIMQEAFIKAFKKIKTYSGEATFGAWLKRIVINKSLTQIKKNSRFEEVKFDVLENTIEDDGSIAGNETIDYSIIKAREILKTIDQLKDNYRIALTLSLIEGYDNEEISKIMKISNENCRTTISRAKNKLRRLLQHDTLVN